ncbi:MAG: O-antigen ligase family protein [Chloroflexota bacterium]
MAAISAQQSTRTVRGLASAIGLAIVAMAAGLAIAVAIGAGIKVTMLVAGLFAPFALLVVFARPHWATIVYVALVYADLLSILVEYQGLPPLARLAGSLLLSSVLGFRLIIHKRGLVADTMSWWMVAYGLVLALGLLFARSPDRVMTELVEFGRGFLTYLVVINTLTTVGRIKGALYALLATGVLLASLTVLQTVTGDFSNDFGGLAQAKVTGITELSEAPRPGGTIGDANYYGQNLLLVLPFGLYLASRGRKPLGRLAGVVATMVLIAAVIFTYSRGDLLALVAIVFAALLYKKPPLPLILSGLVLLGLLLSFLPTTYFARLSALVEIAGGNRSAIIAESSLRGRAGAVAAAVGMFADHPILGVGRNNYPLYELDYVAGTSLALKSQGIPPHDLYLEIAAEQGVVGLIVMAGILLTAAQALREARRRFLALGDGSAAELVVWLGIGLFGYLVTSVFLHGAFLYMLWLQLALIVAARQVARSGSIIEWRNPITAPLPSLPGDAEHEDRIRARLESWVSPAVHSEASQTADSKNAVPPGRRQAQLHEAARKARSHRD